MHNCVLIKMSLHLVRILLNNEAADLTTPFTNELVVSIHNSILKTEH